MMTATALLLLLSLGQTNNVSNSTTAAPGVAAPRATAVQGTPGGVPVPVTGSLSVSGAGDTVGANATYNANSVCGFVATAGQTGVGFFLAAGTLSATLTPSVSTDSTTGTNGTWTATTFNDITGASSANLVLTNPNAAAAYGLKLMAGIRYARVCTTSFTSGSAVGNLVASTPQAPSSTTTNLSQISGTAADTNSGSKSNGTLRVVLATDQPALSNKLLVTPDSVALPANQSVNMNQIAGTAADVNSGVKSNGTLRVILATDQPALTNKLLVTPDSVALPANQSVNVSQINSVTPSMGNGVSGTGVQRFTLASDSTGQVALAAGSATIGSLAANQSVNNSQINGVTPLMGNGVTGTGSQRVTIASDNSPFTVNSAQSGTWTMQPGNTQNTTPWLTQQSDGTTTPPICNICAPITATSLNGVQRIITGVSAKKVYVCSWHVVSSAAVSVSLVEGTQASTACDTNPVNVTGPEPDAANSGVSGSNPYAMPYTTVNANDLCIKTSGAATLGGQICYVIK
jgi:hypothetical protein